MTFDKNEFFIETAKRITSSLDVETALWRCLQYLETVIPVTGMNLQLFERDFTEMRTIAHVTRYEIEKLDRIMSLPDDAGYWFKRGWSEMREAIIINQPESNPAMRAITETVGQTNASIMLMRLEMEGKRLGGLSIFADGKGRYTSEHAELLSLLHDPFAIAMSNALRHEEVRVLKDKLADDNKYLHQELLRISGDEIVGKDKGLKDVMTMVRQVATLNSPVLLLGETGVGKEVIANAVHYSSNRQNGPFIKVNCGAIPEFLVDSELFGHEKGAFTGAVSQKRGRFERAQHGTILLDEIGELPPPAQIRLLRVLQNKEIERVGGTKPITVDIRVIASTHRDLQQMVRENQFREDLWFRLNVFPITIPPLRDRKPDIPDLVHHFVERKADELMFQASPSFSNDTLESLMSYNWPGNVRELENMVERALIQNRGQNESGPLMFETFSLPGQKGKRNHP
jgi:transcriptional regulator with GAF, ATPase, and Fis domain